MPKTKLPANTATKTADILVDSSTAKFTAGERKHGQASVVHKVESNADGSSLGNTGESLAFAKDRLDFSKDANGSEKIASQPLFVGQDRAGKGDDRGLITRSVASSQIDQFIGTNILAEEKVMVGQDGKTLNVSVQVDGVPIVDNDNGRYFNIVQDGTVAPELQRGLSDLQTLDYLTGQVDRHCGNIFVDPETNQIKGIDNDLAFPEQDLRATLDSEPLELNAKIVATPPAVMHQDTADKILAVKPEDLRAKLESVNEAMSKVGDGKTGMISPVAIDGAVSRLQTLQEGLKNGNIQQVATFDDTTYKASLDQANNDFAAACIKAKVETKSLAEMSTLGSSNAKWASTNTEHHSNLGRVLHNNLQNQMNGLEESNGQGPALAKRNESVLKDKLEATNAKIEQLQAKSAHINNDAGRLERFKDKLQGGNAKRDRALGELSKEKAALEGALAKVEKSKAIQQPSQPAPPQPALQSNAAAAGIDAAPENAQTESISHAPGMEPEEQEISPDRDIDEDLEIDHNEDHDRTNSEAAGIEQSAENDIGVSTEVRMSQ